MAEPGADPSPGISSEDVLIPTERHPACRQREARPGFGTERENLTGDAKGKGASGYNRKAESTDAPERDGLPRSSAEVAVMAIHPTLCRLARSVVGPPGCASAWVSDPTTPRSAPI